MRTKKVKEIGQVNFFNDNLCSLIDGIDNLIKSSPKINIK